MDYAAAELKFGWHHSSLKSLQVLVAQLLVSVLLDEAAVEVPDDDEAVLDEAAVEVPDDDEVPVVPELEYHLQTAGQDA